MTPENVRDWASAVLLIVVVAGIASGIVIGLRVWWFAHSKNVERWRR